MTLSTEINLVEHTGNGATTEWPYDFRIPTSAGTPLYKVYLVEIATREITELELGTDFSITGLGSENGGIVTYPLVGSPLSSAFKIVIERDVPYTQETSASNQDGFFLEIIEEQLDRIVMQTQQLQERVSRAVQVPVGSDPDTLPSLVNDLITLADSIANIDLVANDIGNVNAVAAVAAELETVADNILDVTNFSDVYLGPKAIAPSLRNDGSALVEGDLYFNTTVGGIRVYTGTEWVASATVAIGGVRQQVYIATAGQVGPFVVTGGFDQGSVNINGVEFFDGYGVTFNTGAGTFFVDDPLSLDDVVVFRGYLTNNAVDIYTKNEVDQLFEDFNVLDSQLPTTMTGKDFSSNVRFLGNNQLIEAAGPRLDLYDTSGNANLRRCWLAIVSGRVAFRRRTDANVGIADVFDINIDTANGPIGVTRIGNFTIDPSPSGFVDINSVDIVRINAAGLRSQAVYDNTITTPPNVLVGTNGNMVRSTYNVRDASNLNTGQVPVAQLPAVTRGAVRSYALCQLQSGTVLGNATVAGSSLRYACFDATGVVAIDNTPTGTWRNMGAAVVSVTTNTSLFNREA